MPSKNHNEISTIKVSEQPVKNECSPIADRILFACPTCGSEQVHKSIGGMNEHAAAVDIPSPGYNISETVCIKNVTYSSKHGIYSGYTNDGRIWYMKKVIYNGGEVVSSKLLVLIYPKSMQSEATPFINIIKNWR